MRQFYKNIATLFITLVLLIGMGYAKDMENHQSISNIERYKSMRTEELFEKGDSFFAGNVKDSALICYSLLYDRNIDKDDTLMAHSMCKALNNGALIYFNNCDYKTSLELLLKALNICEEFGYDEYIKITYNNIGNIHYSFKEYKLAKKYYELSYRHCKPDKPFAAALNNLGMIAYLQQKPDSALFFFNKSYSVQLDSKDSLLYDQLCNIGMVYYNLRKYDTAFLYYRAALNNARRLGADDKTARFMSYIGVIFNQIENYDSAKYYFEQSNIIAKRERFLDVLSQNYLNFSKIETVRGNTNQAFEYYKQYSDIKDSIFNASKYGSINELQFLYDMTKVDKQIKELNVEQEINERTIIIQRRLQMFMTLALIIITTSFIMIYIKNKKLNSAYKGLVAKNFEIVNSDKLNQSLRTEYVDRLNEKDETILKLQEQLTQYVDIVNEREDAPSVRYKNSTLRDDYKSELISAILEIMSDNKVFCDPEFSLNKLAEIVGSNSTYVSQIINDSFNKNFRSFINDYRIKEARRILSDQEYQKYSMESISMMVGFKSKSTFNLIFKEITGITPSFYVRQLHDNE